MTCQLSSIDYEEYYHGEIPLSFHVALMTSLINWRKVRLRIKFVIVMQVAE